MNEYAKIQELILAQEWWAILLEGIVALVFGILVLALPGITLAVLVIFFGAFVFVDGIFALAALSQAEKGRRWMLILQGVCGIAVGIITLVLPGITIVVLLMLIIAWVLVTGIFKLIAAFKLPAGAEGKWLLGLSGFFSVLIGVLLFSLPIWEELILVCFLIGLYAIFAGITLFTLAFTLRSKKKQVQARSTG